MEEFHLFIIWEKAQKKKEEMLSNIRRGLNIIKIVEVKWPRERFTDNLSRFYGTNLPKNSRKEVECGDGPFTVVIVKDENPIYFQRQTSHGKELVNQNIFDRKELFRNWTNDESTPRNYHGSRVHGSNNSREAKHDIFSLFGVSAAEICENPDILPDYWEKNVCGLDGWDSLSQVFNFLNQSLNYLVMRNYEYLPNFFRSEEHGDIDLLTDKYSYAKQLLGGVSVFKAGFRVHEKVVINGKDVFFDLRHVGDDYYCRKWEEEMLQNKIFHKNGFPIMEDTDYKYSLLYHALFHKPFLSKDYREKLTLLFPDLKETEYYVELQGFLKEKKYEVTLPKDLSVYINEDSSGMRFRMDRKFYYFLVKIDKHFIRKVSFVHSGWEKKMKGKMESRLQELEDLMMLKLVRWKVLTWDLKTRSAYLKGISSLSKFQGYRMKLIGKKGVSSTGAIFIRARNGKNDLFIKGNESEIFHCFENEVKLNERISSFHCENDFLTALFSVKNLKALVFPYVNGKILKDLLKERTLSDMELEVFGNFCIRVLDILFENQVIHRDFRTENIMVYQNQKGEIDRFQLFDFGASMERGFDVWGGTSFWDHYFSEQVGGEGRCGRYTVDDAASALYVYKQCGGKQSDETAAEIRKRIGRLFYQK